MRDTGRGVRVLALVAACVLTGGRAGATTIGDAGARGSSGTAGLPGDPGSDGTSGEDGGEASAIARSADAENIATATGGWAGRGGSGGDGIGPGADGGAGGDGGDGGDATAIAGNTVAAADAVASATATGGPRGNGGRGGRPGEGGTAGVDGLDGLTGGMSATATALGLENTSATATALGGTATALAQTSGTGDATAEANGVLASATAEGGGIVDAYAQGDAGSTAHAVSDGGDASARLWLDFFGAAGPRSVENAVSGSAAGILRLDQNILGRGSISSLVEATNPGGDDILVFSRASTTAGGDTTSVAHATDVGNVHAIAIVTTNDDGVPTAEAVATSTGGGEARAHAGLLAFSVRPSHGREYVLENAARAYTTGPTRVTQTVDLDSTSPRIDGAVDATNIFDQDHSAENLVTEQYTNGGWGLERGGIGRSVTRLTNDAGGVEVSVRSYGGLGGAGFKGGLADVLVDVATTTGGSRVDTYVESWGGPGGDAVADITARAALDSEAVARGWSYGGESEPTLATGGDAWTSSTAVADSALATAFASALGGDASPSSGAGGGALAEATAISNGGVVATAIATAGRGAEAGDAHARATVDGLLDRGYNQFATYVQNQGAGAVESAFARTSVSYVGDVTWRSESLARQGGDEAELGLLELAAASVVTLGPSAGAAQAALAGNFEAAQDWDLAGRSEVFALAKLGGGAGAPQDTFQSTSRLDISLDTEQLDAEDHLLVSFVDPVFESVTPHQNSSVRILFRLNGELVFAEYGNEDPVAAFDDRTVDLGAFAELGDGALGLSVEVEVRVFENPYQPTVQERFFAHMLIGSSQLGILPEPSAGVLFAIGLAVMSHRRRTAR